MKHTIRSFSLLLATVSLCLISGTVLAADFPSSGTALSMAPPPGDLSVAYLANIFGGIGSILPGPEFTVISNIFKYFNIGLLTIAGVIISFTTFQAIIGTAQDGEPMGKKLNVWVVFRTVGGIGLLVPKAAGYSMMQTFMIWAVLQGVGLADILWTNTLDFLQKGGTIYHISSRDPNNEPIDPNRRVDALYVLGGADGTDTSQPYQTTYDTYAGALAVLRAEVCMNMLERTLKRQKTSTGSTFKELKIKSAKDASIAATSEYKDVQSEFDLLSAYSDLKPLPNDKLTYLSFPGNLPKNTKYGALNGACGAIGWTWLDSRTDQGIITGNQGYQRIKYTALSNMAATLMPLARQIVDQYYKDGKKALPPVMSMTQKYDEENPFNTQIIRTLILAGSQYQGAVAAMRLSQPIDYKPSAEADAEKETKLMQFYEDAKRKGWVSAGSYYYNLIKVQRTSSKIDVKYDKLWGTQNDDAHLTDIPYVSPPRVGEKDAGTPDYFKFLELAGARGWNSGDTADFKSILSWTNDLHVGTHFVILKYVNPAIQTAPPSSQLSITVDKDSKKGGLGSLQAYIEAVRTGGYKVVSVPNIEFVKEGANIIYDPLNEAIAHVLGAWYDTMVQSRVPNSEAVIEINSPVEKLFYYGDAMTTASLNAWGKILDKISAIAQNAYNIQTNYAIAVSASSAAAAIPWVGTIGLAAQKISETWMTWNQFILKLQEMGISFAMPLATIIFTMMFTTGMTLSLYIPLVPYVLYTLGVLSWLIFVIEAMVAAPLACLGLMDPRAGQDEVLGKASEAQMLLFAVFLRPSAMFIGLMTGTILSFVGLTLLNSTFNAALNAVWLSTGTADVNSMYGSLKYMSIILVYTLIMTTVFTKCYECIYSVPDQIMQWIGARGRPSGDERLLGEFKQGVSDASGQMARGAGDVLGGAGKAGTSTILGDTGTAAAKSTGEGTKAGVDTLKSIAAKKKQKDDSGEITK